MPLITDVHAHYTPADYFKCAQKGLGGSYEDKFLGFPEPMSLEERFAMMSEAGVRKQILSPTTTPYSSHQENSILGAQTVNNAFASLSNQHADKFDFWISLPLPYTQAARRRSWLLMFEPQYS